MAARRATTVRSAIAAWLREADYSATAPLAALALANAECLDSTRAVRDRAALSVELRRTLAEIRQEIGLSATAPDWLAEMLSTPTPGWGSGGE